MHTHVLASITPFTHPQAIVTYMRKRVTTGRTRGSRLSTSVRPSGSSFTQQQRQRQQQGTPAVEASAGSRSMECLDLPVYSGTLNAELYEVLAKRKLSRFTEYAAIYPECCFVLVGDNGQVR